MNVKDFIKNHIPDMDSPEKVYQLFRGLGYKTLDPSFRGIEAWELREKDRENVDEIYTVADYRRRFQIFLVKLKSHSSETIRKLPIYFERETLYPFFVVTADWKNYTFVLVQKIREDVGVWKRKIIKLNLDRENAYYTDKWILSEIAIDDEVDEPNRIYNTLLQSFSIEKVTKKFFNGYKDIFDSIREYFFKQVNDKKWAHEFSLQLLNRIMFLYFVQKKRWLGNNQKFINEFWNAYINSKKEKDSFYEKWLSVLFFEAFNNKFFTRPYFPDNINTALAIAPYFNGGLFTPNKLDDLTACSFKEIRNFVIEDSLFKEIFKFFNGYNFTIREELPLEVEVAVDPEMIGKVYESLVNISEDIDKRGEAGIFYTARTEIDFMCRRSLVEYFYNHLNIEKSLIYKFVFATDEKEKEKIDAKISSLNLWDEIELLLEEVTIIDPACGSGSFLVGMLNILTDLFRRTYSQLNRQVSDFDIKKSIIGRSLYGVDVMEWAVHIAELRLWLQLIIETELDREQLKTQPLLPNLTFKIRCGDSLVQEIGGINLDVRTGSSGISSSLKKKLNNLKIEKLKYYNNDPSCKFKKESMLLKEELNIFRSILDDRALNLSNEIKKSQRRLLETSEQGAILTVDGKQEQIKSLNNRKKEKKKLDKLKKELNKIKEARLVLKGIYDKPFVWDIDFAEIFSGEKNGFDIVIGNPPYVRQEKIAPPHIPDEKLTVEMKREYKNKLETSIMAHFDNRIKKKKLDRKSDLYIYFYFYGLTLLNPEGTFCFITSNSWLDVGYGKDLQEFLLENVHIKAIYDNSAKRSFTQADINTIIVLFSAPLKKRGDGLKKYAKFVLFLSLIHI